MMKETMHTGLAQVFQQTMIRQLVKLQKASAEWKLNTRGK